MFGTDTFLAGYARKGHPADFASLRYIFAGAAKLMPDTRAAYMAKFKKPVFEGFGATETGPVLALNTMAHSREGSVGRLLPGVERRVEKLEGFAADGKLWVRGPNLMLGYLKLEQPGVIQPLTDGWYDTGDAVNFDAAGYLYFIDRVRRIAKPGGEMVSLGAAEALVASVWPDAVHAVVGVPDSRKGQRLLLVTTRSDATPQAILAVARTRGIAELMVPREVMVVDKLPLLPTGKINYPAVAVLAAARSQPHADEPEEQKAAE